VRLSLRWMFLRWNSAVRTEMCSNAPISRFVCSSARRRNTLARARRTHHEPQGQNRPDRLERHPVRRRSSADSRDGKRAPMVAVAIAFRSHNRQRWMEPLWSPVVASAGNQRQIDSVPNPQKQAKSVATGCHRLPDTLHGKGALPLRKGGGRLLGSARSAKSCEPEGPQDLDAVTLSIHRSSVKP
jgi:hypothetical protein